ncbi:MAG: helix-turn-helix domain-containing protein [Acidobacteria bacterium]|nr:helix-turn-helix domain-containing protein [Acidobacteriota bacterium]
MTTSNNKELTPLANTLQDVEKRTGLSVPYLRQRVKAKDLKVTRFGRAIRILESDLMDFLRKGVGNRNER